MSYKYFSNRECEYYPCHGIDGQNCLFCYCPLYFFKDCGGDPNFMGAVKDCSKCTKNHDEKSYEFIMGKLKPAFSKLGKEIEMMSLNSNEHK
ncbi:MAG: cysteine-rich small domain-containing protein [Deferribacterales bacterium]